MNRRTLTKLALTGALGSALGLTAACATGVPQSEVDALKQQLAIQEQRASALQQQLSVKQKESLDLQQQLSAKDKEIATLQQAKPAAAAPSRVVTLIGARPAPTPAPPATPTPAPPGFQPPPKPQPPATLYEPVGPFFVSPVTLTGRATGYGYESNVACVPSGRFARGTKIVFRVEVLDTASGKVFTDQNGTVTVQLPHGEERNLRFQILGAGRIPNAPWSWAGAWDIPLDYPLGFLNYKIAVVGKDGRSFTWKAPDFGTAFPYTVEIVANEA